MPHFNVRIGGICVRDQKVLLIRRNPDFYPETRHLNLDCWEFCGGALETGETPEQAIAREYREECGIEVSAEFLFHTRVGERNNVPMLTLVYACRYVSGDISLTDEHTDHKWVGLDELRGLDLGGFYNADRDAFLSDDRRRAL